MQAEEANGEAERKAGLDNLESILKSQEFAGRDSNLVKELLLNASVERFVDDQVIFHENDDVDRLYFIENGEAAVCVDDQPIEKISSGKVIGLGAIFETLGLPVTIKAMASCNCHSVSRQNLLSALQKYPEDANHLRSFAERLCKEETSRWEKRGAILRTKRKLKAISAMRNGRKLAHRPVEEMSATSTPAETPEVSEPLAPAAPAAVATAATPTTPTSSRPLQDEAKRRQKLQMIREGMAARQRGEATSSAWRKGRAVRTATVPLDAPDGKDKAADETSELVFEVDELELADPDRELCRQYSRESQQSGSPLLASGGRARTRRQGSGSITCRKDDGSRSAPKKKGSTRSFLPVLSSASPAT